MSDMPRQDAVLQAKCACGRNLTVILVSKDYLTPHYITGCVHCIAASDLVTTPTLRAA
jgi:hypothetical protein